MTSKSSTTNKCVAWVEDIAAVEKWVERGSSKKGRAKNFEENPGIQQRTD